ncbi:MAG: methyltransferase domain-containing protein [Pseudomonadota bacterium]
MSSTHFCRIMMDRGTDQMIRSIKPETLDACEISGTKWREFGFKSFTHLHYPRYDICEGIDIGPFDLVIAEQVWEHLKAPYTATKNVFELLRPGGYFLISVPFLLKYHGNPIDCTRWNREGLKNLLIEGGFHEDDIQSEDWGNKTCVVENLTSWVDYDPARHDLEHDPIYPIVSWALARKPLTSVTQHTATDQTAEKTDPPTMPEPTSPPTPAPVAAQATTTVTTTVVETTESQTEASAESQTSSAGRPYWMDMTVRSDTEAHLGGNINQGDSKSITPALWDYLITRFALRTMLDVGAGQGHAVAHFHRKGVISLGIDGLRTNIDHAVHPLILHDLLTGPFVAPVDMTHCVELVEHVSEEAIDNLMETLCNGKIVVMTHGLPGQKGHHHVNCQPPEYWIDLFDQRGYRLSEEIAALRNMSVQEVGGTHFSKSGLVFIRR